MDSYLFLVQLSAILLCTKLLGILTKRVSLPQVVGALIAGLLLGPACFGLIPDTAFLDEVAELGVITLMFTAGMETDLDGLKRAGKAAFIIALIGVLLPLVMGFAAAALFNRGEFLQNLFIGVVLTATSVSITVETLKELGKLSTRSGNAILGAALIDDVLGIVALTIVTSLSGKGGGLGLVLLKIALFFALSVLVGFVLHRLISLWFSRWNRDKRRFLIVAFALCLLYAYLSEVYFGVADITGAYIMGIIFANTPRVTYLQDRFDTLSCMLLSPVFFASIGLKVALPEMSASIVLFALLLVLVALVSKVVGVGMISRGEVALIVANKGISSGLMKEDFFGPVVLVVIATTVITPILLKLVYRGSKNDYSDLEESALLDRYEDASSYDKASQMLLEDHVNLLPPKEKK